MSTIHSPADLNKKLYILQHNKIKGVKKGQLDKSSWNQECTEFVYEDQIAQQTQNSTYLAAIVDPQTGDIVEWK